MIKTGRYVFVAGAIFWLLENIYFGWNKTAQSIAEAHCDKLAGFIESVGFGLIFWGIVNLAEQLEKVTNDA